MPLTGGSTRCSQHIHMICFGYIRHIQHFSLPPPVGDQLTAQLCVQDIWQQIWWIITKSIINLQPRVSWCQLLSCSYVQTWILLWTDCALRSGSITELVQTEQVIPLSHTPPNVVAHVSTKVMVDNGAPRWSIFQHPAQSLMESWILSLIHMHKFQLGFVPWPKGQGSTSLFTWENPNVHAPYL